MLCGTVPGSWYGSFRSVVHRGRGYVSSSVDVRGISPGGVVPLSNQGSYFYGGRPG
jgi:hypothetical protein